MGEHYIELEEAINTIKRMGVFCEAIRPDQVIYVLKELPRVTSPNLTAEWIRNPEFDNPEDVANDNLHYSCSHCGHGDVHSKSTAVNFCWHCGAKMKNGGEE